MCFSFYNIMIHQLLEAQEFALSIRMQALSGLNIFIQNPDQLGEKT